MGFVLFLIRHTLFGKCELRKSSSGRRQEGGVGRCEEGWGVCARKEGGRKGGGRLRSSWVYSTVVPSRRSLSHSLFTPSQASTYEYADHRSGGKPVGRCGFVDSITVSERGEWAGVRREGAAVEGVGMGWVRLERSGGERRSYDHLWWTVQHNSHSSLLRISLLQHRVHMRTYERRRRRSAGKKAKKSTCKVITRHSPSLSIRTPPSENKKKSKKEKENPALAACTFVA